MEKVADKDQGAAAPPQPKGTDPGDNAGEGWNPYDEYDTRSAADTPAQTPEYIENTMPWLKDATAKRQAEKAAAPLPAIPKKKADPKKS